MTNILQQHAQAVLDLLAVPDGLTPALVVLDGKVPDGQTRPYVLPWFRMRTPTGLEEPDKVSLENTSDVINTTVYAHCVGDGPQASLACRAVAGRVRARLLGVIPVITGRVCYPITHEDSVPPNPDETTGVEVYDLVDVYSFISQPG